MMQNLQVWLLSLSKLWLNFLPAAACVRSRRHPLLSGTLWHSILGHSFVVEQLDCFLVVMPRTSCLHVILSGRDPSETSESLKALYRTERVKVYFSGTGMAGGWS